MTINRLGFAIALAIAILAVAAGLSYARGAGMLGADDSPRAMQVLIGLVLAAYANFMPKQLGPARRSATAESHVQSALRVGGWSMMLAGLAYAALWALAPLAVADTASVAVVAAALVVMLGYSVRAYAACRSAGGASVGG